MIIDLNTAMQIGVYVVGYVGMWVMFERRMTRVETHMVHLLKVIPKRKEDETA